MRLSIVALLVLLLFPSVAFEADRAVPFAIGETLTYDVSMTRFVTAGTATLTVRERRATGGGRAAYYIVAEARPSRLVESLYRVYYKAESFVDTETLRPTVATIFSDERGRTRRRLMRFRPGNVADYEVQLRSNPVNKTEFKTQPSSLDPLSVLYVLRTMPLKPGESATVPIANNGKNYRMRVSVGSREQVRTGLGSLPALKLTPVIQDEAGKPATTRNLTLWLSDDARRLPLKMEVDLPVGSFALSLASAKK
jgi:hypothetical protein